jgi:hypothetical protein
VYYIGGLWALIFLKYLRMGHFFICLLNVEELILDVMEFFAEHFSTLNIKKASWSVFPRILLVLTVFLNIFTNAFLLFRFKIIMDEDISDNNVTSKGSQMDDDDHFGIYTTMLYYVVTTITGVGYGDVIPRNQYEYIVAIILLNCGVFLYGFVIAKIRIVVNTNYTLQDIRGEQLEDFDSFLSGFELRRKRTLIEEKIHPYKKFEPVMWNCKVANYMRVKSDGIHLFRSNFFSQLPENIKVEIFDSYLFQMKSKYSGVYKLFAKILTFDLFSRMEIKV